MVVAMISVRMMEMPCNYVVHVVTVGDRQVTAARTVMMTPIVRLVPDGRRALVRVGGGDLDAMLLESVGHLVIQVAIVEIVDVAGMMDRRVPASRAVLVFPLDLLRHKAS